MKAKAMTCELRSLFIALGILSTLGAGSSTGLSQTTSFTYQGHLQDTGVPASGFYDLCFRLYDAQANGNQIADTLTNSALPVTDGLFTTVLDFGSGVFNGSNYWLEIGVRTNGSAGFATLSPRQPITSTPYAVFAPAAGDAAFASVANTAASATTANSVGSVAGTNIAQLNVPDTAIQATGTVAVVSGFIVGVHLLDGGYGYVTAPSVSVADASGSNAVITAVVSNGAVANLTIDNAGNNYSTNAALFIAPPPSNARQTFNGGNIFTGINTLTNLANVFAGSFSGDGSGLMNLNAGRLTGTATNFSAGAINMTGNLYLPVATAGAGVIYSGGNTLLAAYEGNFFGGQSAGNLTMSGTANVAVGPSALQNNTSGSYNTAIGQAALTTNTIGSANTALGQGALESNTSGSHNTADGVDALNLNTVGTDNTATGWRALNYNTAGIQNTADGLGALRNNTAGCQNTASGDGALYYNTVGSSNTASGLNALYNNTAGNNNTASGLNALYNNSTGNANTAAGRGALSTNTTGSNNVAYGYQALVNVQSGSGNIGIGYQAGMNLSSQDSSNIDIGSPGVAGDSRVIRLGTPGIHTYVFLAGTLIGGVNNTNRDSSGSSAITGGEQNLIQLNDTFSGIGGGQNNQILPSVSWSLIAGGQNNTIEGSASWSAIGGGGGNDIQSNSWNSVIAGGGGNLIGTNASNATISGGTGNSILQDAFVSVIAGGAGNTDASPWSVIGGGGNNLVGAAAWESTIGGGWSNSIQANSAQAVVGGGILNTIGVNAGGSFIGGGFNNTVQSNGYFAIIPGGEHNLASAYSLAAGSYAEATNQGSFVWSDGSTNTASTSTNQFVARASGGVVFYTGTDTNTGVWLAPGSGSWSSLSDTNSKDDLLPVDSCEVLEKVAALPMQTWHYKAQSARIRHIGPLAQEFYAAFGLGEDNRHITTIDSEGIALAAIQGLNKKLRQKDAEITELNERLGKLERLIRQQGRGAKSSREHGD